MTGLVEPDCKPVGEELPVALAGRGATGMLKASKQAGVRRPSPGGEGKEGQ